MGTSNSFGGPSGKNPLIPPWAQGDGFPPSDLGLLPDPIPQSGSEADPPSQSPPASPSDGAGERPPPNPAIANIPELAPLPTLAGGKPLVSWGTAKRGLTAYTSSRGDRNRLRSAASRYVAARGGSRTASRSAQAGRASTARVGGFLAGIASGGFKEAARALGLAAYLGRNVDQVLTAIANALAPDGATQEDAVAREAVNDTLAYLYERYGLAGGDLSKLDAMDRADVAEAVGVTVTSYIYHRWVQELGRKLEEHSVSAQDAVRLERDVRAFINETVLLDMTRVDPVTLDWGGPSGQQFVERIYQDAYAMLEGE